MRDSSSLTNTNETRWHQRKKEHFIIEIQLLLAFSIQMMTCQWNLHRFNALAVDECPFDIAKQTSCHLENRKFLILDHKNDFMFAFAAILMMAGRRDVVSITFGLTVYYWSLVCLCLIILSETHFTLAENGFKSF